MKGKLSKTERGWFVKYKMVDDLIATDGGIIPIHPDYEKYYFLNENDEDGEVEFEMVKEYIDERTNQIQTYAKLKQPPKLMYRDGTPIRSYCSPKIQELLDEIKLEEISKEQLEKERNMAYEYFDIKKNFNKFSLYEHKETITSADIKTSTEIEKLASKHYPEYYSIGLGSDKIGFERGYNLGKSFQTEISDEEIYREAIEHSKLYENKFVPRNAFIMGAQWYREQLKNKK